MQVTRIKSDYPNFLCSGLFHHLLLMKEGCVHSYQFFCFLTSMYLNPWDLNGLQFFFFYDELVTLISDEKMEVSIIYAHEMLHIIICTHIF